MKKLTILSFAILFVTIGIKGQKRQSNLEELKPNIIYLNDTCYLITENNASGDTIISGFLSSKNPIIKQGVFLFKYPNGQIRCKGEYFDNVPVGKWTYFDSKGDTIASYDYSKAVNYFTTQVIDSSEQSFFIVEKMPTFQNGDIRKFQKYIQNNIRYPIYAELKGQFGRVYISFIVNKMGLIKNIQVVRGTHYLDATPYLDLNMEAIRVISESPNWSPGLQRNTPINISYTIPIDFHF